MVTARAQMDYVADNFGKRPRRHELDSLPPNAEDLSWGNKVYKIRFEERKARSLFGHRYWFFLRDAVDDVPEYVVHWDNFVQYVLQRG